MRVNLFLFSVSDPFIWFTLNENASLKEREKKERLRVKIKEGGNNSRAQSVWRWWSVWTFGKHTTPHFFIAFLFQMCVSVCLSYFQMLSFSLCVCLCVCVYTYLIKRPRGKKINRHTHTHTLSCVRVFHGEGRREERPDGRRDAMGMIIPLWEKERKKKRNWENGGGGGGGGSRDEHS